MISVGTVGILNKLNSVESEFAAQNKIYNNLLVRVATNESKDIEQDRRINNLEGVVR